MHAPGTTRVRQLGLPEGRAAWACQKAELPGLPPPCLQAALTEVLLEPMGGHGPCSGAALSCLPNQGYKDSRVAACEVSFTAEHPLREGEHQECQRVWHR